MIFKKTVQIIWLLVTLQLIVGCEHKQSSQAIEQEKLMAQIRVGSFIRVADLLGDSMGTICLLYPYQNFVVDDIADRNLINTFLKSIDYQASESYWSLIIIKNKLVNISKFRRSEKLDVINMRDIQKIPINNLSNQFKPMDCVSISDAAIGKIEFENRIFLMLGKLK